MSKDRLPIDVLKELWERARARTDGCINCREVGSCHSPENCQSTVEKLK